jgi:hypothetical protein
MKKILNISLISCAIFLFFSTAQAQVDGEYRQIPELDKYVGTWQWQSGDSVFTIKLAKTVLNFKQYMQQIGGDGPNATLDVLIGWYEFKIGATVMQSSLSSENTLFDYNNINQTIVMGGLYNGIDDEEGPYELVSIPFFHDLIENVSLKAGSFELAEPNLAILSLVGDREGKFSLPKKVLMNRIQ